MQPGSLNSRAVIRQRSSNDASLSGGRSGAWREYHSCACRVEKPTGFRASTEQVTAGAVTHDTPARLFFTKSSKTEGLKPDMRAHVGARTYEIKSRPTIVEMHPRYLFVVAVEVS
ncbi:MAG: head-tail adaptor protein [Pseudomonadota bacterium]